MLDVSHDTPSQILSNQFAKLFRQKNKEKAAKALFMGVSPLALAACGGGSSNNSSDVEEVLEKLVSGTSGDDIFDNSSASETFEGGLGDDYYTFGLSGTDIVKDTGGNDTLRIVWRDADNTRLVSDIHQNGDDLVLEMTGDANVLTVSGFFTAEGNLENVNYYHDGGAWGEGLDGKIYSLQSLENLDETYYPLIVGTQGADNVNLSNSQTTYEITMYTHDGDDVIFTGPSIDYIYAGAGDDSISTGEGDDQIEAGDGADWIYAGGGYNIVDAGSGHDRVIPSEGEFDGGTGYDTLYIPGSNASVTGFSLDFETGLGGYSDSDSLFTFQNFERLIAGKDVSGNSIGSTWSWQVNANSADNMIETADGNDVVYGNGGNDLIEANGGDDRLYGGEGNDEIDGGDGNDFIAGDDGDDILYGGDGDDQIYGGAGNDEFWLSTGSDDYVGGQGSDTLLITGEADDQFPDDLSITLNFADGTGSLTGGPTVLTFSEIENFKAGYDPDDGSYINSTWSYIVTGSDDANTIETAEGDDTIAGGDGDDTIISNGGDDILDGGAGNDHVYAGDGDDVVYMSPGADIEDGGDGVDTLILGEWAGSWSGTLNLETGDNFTAGQTGSTSHKALNFENIRTEHTGDMTIIGTSGNNNISTGAGNDRVEAGAGDDIIYTGEGNDVIDAGAGNDAIWVSSGSDTYVGGSGIDTLRFGGSPDDDYPADLSVTLNFELGTAAITGGPVLINFSEVENLKAGYEGDNYINSTWSFIVTGSDDTNTIETAEGDDTIAGGHGDDTIISNGGDDILDGGDGDDYIAGGDGDDILNGGGGSDTFIFNIGETGTDTIADFDLAEGDNLDLRSYGITTEDAAEALMSDSSSGVNVTIDGSVIVTLTETTVADFAAADGWLA